METSLKEDIISEIRQSGGRMLLHQEEYNCTLHQAIKSSEVYASLEDDRFDLAYRRIPLTSERETFALDVDAV